MTLKVRGRADALGGQERRNEKGRKAKDKGEKAFLSGYINLFFFHTKVCCADRPVRLNTNSPTVMTVKAAD